MTRRCSRETRRARARRSARPPILRASFGAAAPIHVDLFAGGGGASCGKRGATGRSPDIAVNHWPAAIAMHKANHPKTEHYNESVFEVDPAVVCAGRPVEFLWLSPTCTHFSKAKGHRLLDAKIRSQANIIFTWIAHAPPQVFVLENVEEFEGWGPLHKQHSNGCTGDHDMGQGREPGCLKKCDYLTPIKARKGEFFRHYVTKLERKGYVVEWRVLRACDYGAPTTRKRLFLIARRDGIAIEWPEPTHGPGLVPHRAAAECIDFSIPGRSIFGRRKALAKPTLARIGRGVGAYVVNAARPFIAPGDTPIGAIGTRDRCAVVEAQLMIHRSNGERPGQAPRIYDVEKPHPTVVAGGVKTAVVAAVLTKHNGGNESSTGGQPVDRPIDTISARDSKALTLAHMVKFYGTSTGAAADSPLHTIPASGEHLAVATTECAPARDLTDAELALAAEACMFLRGHVADLSTTHVRGHEVAIVSLDGACYVITDIRMRMLEPKELFLANGFPRDYQIDVVGPRGRKLTRTELVRLVGNSVCPPIAEAIVRALDVARCGSRRAAA